MATEIRTITDTWCDVCLLGGDNARVESIWSEPITIGSLKRQFDLCEKHRDELIGRLPEKLEQCGTKLDPKDGRPQTAASVCPKCDGRFANRSALTAHARNVHGKQLAVMEVELGLEPSGRAGRSQPLTCDICGEIYLGPQGLGAHKRGKHGIEGTSPNTTSLRKAG